MKNTTDNNSKTTLIIWAVTLGAYAVFALALWQFDFLRRSTFSVAEAQKAAAEQKEKRDKAKRSAKPPKPKEIPPREIEKIGRELAKKKARQIKKRNERVEEVTEKLNEIVERAEADYRAQRPPEQELYARIAGIISAMSESTKSIGSPICNKLAQYGSELNRLRKDDGADCSSILKHIADENSKIRPFIERVTDPYRRGRLIWQSKELDRLLKAGREGDFTAALRFGEEEKTQEKSATSPQDDRAETLEAFLDERENALESSYSELKSLEDAVATGEALDSVMGDAKLNELAAAEIAQALGDDAQNAAAQALDAAGQAAEVSKNTGEQAALLANNNPGSSAAEAAQKNARNAADAAAQAAAAAKEAATAAEAAKEAFTAGKLAESGVQSRAALAAADKARSALQSTQDAAAGRKTAEGSGEEAASEQQASATDGLPSTREELRNFSSKYNDLTNRAASLANKANSLARQADIAGGNPNETAIAANKFSSQSANRGAVAGAVSAAMSGNGGGPDGKIQLDLSGALRSMSGSGGNSPGGNQTWNSGGSAGEIIDAHLIKPSKFVSPYKDEEIIRQSLPGRRLYPDAKRKGWLFIDSWFVIGPWDATGKRTRDLPVEEPERKIDLDAEYSGKKNPATGEPFRLKWRYLQTDTVNVRPYDQVGNSFYYAYSEVWAAEGMDVTLFIGSDDAAKVWLNDVLIWDDYGLSPWSLSEGAVKVYFKKGYNKVLVKIHNGPAVCRFSITMAPSPKARQ